MRYLLDSSVIINFLRDKKKEVEFINGHQKDEIITSAICEAEVFTGAFRKKYIKLSDQIDGIKDFFESLYKVVSFDDQQAYKAGEIKAQLANSGELIDDLDILIGAAAIASEATLVTANTKHFSRIKNLQITTP